MKNTKRLSKTELLETNPFEMKNIVVFGDTAFGERLAKYVIFEGADKLVGFTQEDGYCSKECLLGLPVIPLSDLKGKKDIEILIAIGYTKMNNLREKIYSMLKEEGFSICTWISSKAIVYSDAIGEGTIILPNVMIGPGCKIGKCNFFESSVSLSHDNKIGDFNFFSTNCVLGGFAEIKNHCFMGLNCTVKSDICISDYTLLGCGSNMLKNSEMGGGIFWKPSKAS